MTIIALCRRCTNQSETIQDKIWLPALCEHSWCQSQEEHVKLTEGMPQCQAPSTSDELSGSDVLYTKHRELLVHALRRCKRSLC